MKVLLASIALACLLASARTACGADALTLGRALERAAADSPILAAQRASGESIAARAARDSLGTPITFGVDLENFAGGGELAGMDSAETTLRVGRAIELGGKRSARRALGEAQIASESHALLAAQVDVATVATHRFVEVAADQERVALANEAVRLAESTRSEVARAVERARNPETDLHAADLALADAELEREHAEHELASARMTLASSWGAFEADFPAVLFALRATGDPASFETLAATLPEAVALRAAGLAEDTMAATVRVAESQARPDIALSLGVRRLEAFADHGLVMSVSMPLGAEGRSRLALAEARAGQRAQTHSRAALRADLHQRLFEKYQELVHARTELRALDESLLPKARAALALAQRGFEAGRFAFAVLSQTQRTLFDLRRREIDAAARYHALRADIQKLTTPGSP